MVTAKVGANWYHINCNETQEDIEDAVENNLKDQFGKLMDQVDQAVAGIIHPSNNSDAEESYFLRRSLDKPGSDCEWSPLDIKYLVGKLAFDRIDLPKPNNRIPASAVDDIPWKQILVGGSNGNVTPNDIKVGNLASFKDGTTARFGPFTFTNRSGFTAARDDASDIPNCYGIVFEGSVDESNRSTYLTKSDWSGVYIGKDGIRCGNTVILGTTPKVEQEEQPEGTPGLQNAGIYTDGLFIPQSSFGNPANSYFNITSSPSETNFGGNTLIKLFENTEGSIRYGGYIQRGSKNNPSYFSGSKNIFQYYHSISVVASPIVLRGVPYHVNCGIKPFVNASNLTFFQRVCPANKDFPEVSDSAYNFCVRADGEVRAAALKVYNCTNGYMGESGCSSTPTLEVTGAWIKAAANASITGTLSVSGDMTAKGMKLSTSLYVGNKLVASSDRKLKDNIFDIEENAAKSFIMNLKPVSYSFKTELDKKRLGFIAQDIANAAKTTIGTSEIVVAYDKKDENKANNLAFADNVDDENLDWYVSYLDLIAPTVTVVQSHEKEIQKLRQEVASLKKQLEVKNA